MWFKKKVIFLLRYLDDVIDQPVLSTVVFGNKEHYQRWCRKHHRCLSSHLDCLVLLCFVHLLELRWQANSVEDLAMKRMLFASTLLTDWLKFGGSTNPVGSFMKSVGIIAPPNKTTNKEATTHCPWHLTHNKQWRKIQSLADKVVRVEPKNKYPRWTNHRGTYWKTCWDVTITCTWNDANIILRTHYQGRDSSWSLLRCCC